MAGQQQFPKRLGAEWSARLIQASTLIDRAHRTFDVLRGEVVLALASDAVLDRFNDLIYGNTHVYRPDSSAFRPHLFTWEQRAVERFFPPPPARILIGGVGGGREAFALDNLGYETVAFEPSQLLVEAMLAQCAGRPRVRPLLGGYQELPRLQDLRTRQVIDVAELGPFDAGILGWSSYSHLRTAEQREQALMQFRECVKGPLLVSFFRRPEPEEKRKPTRRLRRWLRSKFNQDPGNAFSVYIGFYHQVSGTEITQSAGRCGLRLLHLNLDEEGESWPHAVFQAGGDLGADPSTNG